VEAAFAINRFSSSVQVNGGLTRGKGKLRDVSEDVKTASLT